MMRFVRRFPVVCLLLAANVGVFVVMAKVGKTTDVSVLLRFGANEAIRIWRGEYWRMAAAAFIHIGLAHLLVNAVALLFLGSAVETLLGHLRFLVMYLVCAFSGSVATLLFTNGISAGASGAIFGLAGALLVFELYLHRHIRTSESKDRLISILAIIVLNLALGFFVPHIDYNGHIGGLIAGIWLGWFFFSYRFGAAGSWLRGGILACFVLTLGSVTVYAIHPVRNPRWLSYQGQIEFERRNYKQSEQYFRKALSIDEKALVAHQGLMDALERQGRLRDLVRACQSAIRAAPGRAALHQRLGTAYLLLGQYEKAVTQLQQSLRLAPVPYRDYYLLGTALDAAGRTEEAIKAFDHGTRLHPHDPRNWARLGALFLAKDHRDVLKAKMCFEKALASDPKDAGSWAGLGASYLSKQINDVGKAKQCFKNAIKYAPEDAWSWQRLGRLYLQEHPPNVAKAKEAFEAAVKNAPKDAANWGLLGVVYIGQQFRDYGKALECLNRAHVLQPDEAIWQRLRVTCLRNLCRYAEAREAGKPLANATPPDPRAAIEVALSALALKDYDEAIRYARQAADGAGFECQAHEILRKAYIGLKRFIEARIESKWLRQHYERLFEEKPTATNANNLAWFYAVNGIELAKALKLAAAAYEAEKQPSFADTLGWVLVKSGRPKDAIPILRAAARKEHGEEYWYHLGVALFKADQTQEARKALAKSLQRGYDFEGREEALSLLGRISSE